MKQIFFSLVILWTINTKAQTDTAKKDHPLSFSGYAEVYYLYDINKPQNHHRPPFFYSYNRTGEINLNLAFLKAAYSQDNIRANFGLMAGTYPNANLASEPGVFKKIYEANMGIKLSKKKALWVDAGILPSHIGFESAIGKDCWTLTRSILAENSPYYEAGVRTSYTSTNSKWYIAVLLLNGWQRIQRIEGNNTPAFGTQLTFAPSNKLVFNSSTFIGNDKPDSIRQMRYFHSFYTLWQLTKKWGLTIGFDNGIEQIAKGSSKMNTWYSPVMIIRYQPTNNWFISARAEYYHDRNGVIAPLVNARPFNMKGFSLNTDYNFSKNLLWRMEVRLLNNGSPYFLKGNQLSKSNLCIATALAIKIN